MTKEIDEVTKPKCSSPVKIIKAASKARCDEFDGTMSNSDLNQNKGCKNSTKVINSCHYNNCDSTSSMRRKPSPPDSPSHYLMKGNNNVRPRKSKSANRDAAERHEQTSTHSEFVFDCFPFF